MIPDTARRLRPVTANVTQRKRNNKDPPTSATSSRRLRRAVSAKGRIQPAPVVDLNPPVWPPLLCELYPERDPFSLTPPIATESRSGSETSIASAARERPTLPDIVRRIQETQRAGKSVDYPEENEEKEGEEGEDRWCSKRVEMTPKAPPPKPPSASNIKTREDLKKFLSAAMDSVRFFLVTSSIGQANKKDEPKDEDSEGEESEKEEDFIIPRCELIIKNAALTDKPWRFSIETYRDDPKMLEFYTGFKSYDLIQSIFKLIKPSQETIQKWEETETEGRCRDGAFRSGILTLFDEFFMFLLKLRQNLSSEDLSVRFCMKESEAENIVNDWLHYLFTCFGRSPVWASRDNTDIFMPMCFKSLSPCARIVIHVAKISVRALSNHAGTEYDDAKTETLTSSQPEVDQSETESNIDESPRIDSPRIRNISRRNASSRPQTPTGEIGKSGTKNKSKLKKKNSSQRLLRTSLLRKREKNDTDVETEDEMNDNVRTSDNKLPSTTFSKTCVNDGRRHYKSMVIFQPTGAAAFIGRLYPDDYKTEDILLESGVLELLDECDDIVTLDPRDELDHSTVEEMIHPYAVNYLNSNFLRGQMSVEELEVRSPLKAHRLKCMHWHVYHSVEWIQGMKIWDELAEWSDMWVRDVERVWTISCLLSNFLPADPCLDIGTTG